MARLTIFNFLDFRLVFALAWYTPILPCFGGQYIKILLVARYEINAVPRVSLVVWSCDLVEYQERNGLPPCRINQIVLS